MTIKVGDVLQDNDPRQNGKRVTVIAIENEDAADFAVYQAGRRRARIRCDRIFTDGKPRTKGFNLVRE